MKKFLLVGMNVIMSCVCIACNKTTSVQNNNSNESSSQMVMGGGEEKEIVLDASKVPDCSIEQKYLKEIEGLINGSKGYEAEHNDFMEQIADIVKDEGLCLYGEKKLNISMCPVFEWSGETNEIIYNTPKVVVFSHDLTKAASFELIREDEKYKFHSYGDMETKLFDTLKENKDKEFLLLGAYEQEELLSSENELTQINGMNFNTVEVKGNYYSKLKDSGILISMNGLTKNLKKMSFSA